jgi:hypothetical protein
LLGFAARLGRQRQGEGKAARTGSKPAAQLPESAPRRTLREIPAFTRLSRSVGLAVEAGQRLHVSLGRGGLSGIPATSALVGLVMLRRIARATSVSDQPPIATSGDGALGVLSQDTLHSTYAQIGSAGAYDPAAGQVTGLTPFSYAAGVLPVVYDQQVSATVLAGHLGAEAALITDAAERSGGISVAGSDSIPGQAVVFVSASEPLLGEELYAGGAYLQAGSAHTASLRAQDVMRWLIVLAILVLSALELMGVL